jgi:threonine dehydrogenase-like Zn-dependent dehydrogenase
MKALWHTSSAHSQIKADDLPQTGKDHVHLKSLYSLISIGTELTIARGQVPVKLHTSMRVPYQEGEFLFPVKYGYSLVGQKEDSNTLFHIMHPHQSECVVHEKDLFEIPLGIPAKRATLASNVETALTAIWDGEIKTGERIAIVGFGMIGSLIARIASGIEGSRVEVIDPNKARQEYARQFGFRILEDPDDAIEPFDIAFHSSATQEGLQTAIDIVGMEGRIIEMSWYGNRSVTLDLGGDFHLLRKKIISSQVSTIPVRMQGQWDYRRRKQAVFELLKDPAYNQHITHEVSLEEAAELFNAWRKASPEGLGYCIRY